MKSVFYSQQFGPGNSHPMENNQCSLHHLDNMHPPNRCHSLKNNPSSVVEITLIFSCVIPWATKSCIFGWWIITGPVPGVFTDVTACTPGAPVTPGPINWYVCKLSGEFNLYWNQPILFYITYSMNLVKYSEQ